METALQVNLRRHLTEKRLSVYTLEKRAGLKPSAIQNILQGKSKRPTANLLQAIATEFGCQIEDLLKEEDATSAVKVASSEVMGWNPQLYMNALQTVQKFVEQKQLSFSKEKTLDLVNEVYTYSLPRNEIDERFAEWLTEREA